MKLIISSDEKFLYLTPVASDLSKFKGLSMYLKHFDGQIENNQVIIPIDGVDVNSLYSKMRELFVNRLGCELEETAEADKVLSAAIDEAEKFKSFSMKANDIRNNHIDAEELEAFTKTIHANGFKRKLKPFQLLAAYHLAFSQNACNFSVPGSGKTTTVLAAYDYLKNHSDHRKKIDKILIVGPLAAFIAWKKEFKACYGYEPNVLEIRGGVSYKRVEDALLRSNVKEDMIIASYGSIDGKADILKKFIKNNDTMVVLDEAHRIKNVEDGLQSAAALSLATNAKSRVILTGTPAANSYVDLHNLYKFIWPANNIIGYSIPQLSMMSKITDDVRVNDLVKRISPFFIRVKKDDLKLPDPIFHTPEQIGMSPIQQKIYNAIADMAIRQFEDRSLGAAFKRSALIRLRQAATNPSLLNKSLDDYYEALEGDYYSKTELNDEVNVDSGTLELIRNYRDLEVPSKFLRAGELASEIISGEGKLLIWSEFVGTCLDLSNYLNSIGIRNELLYGGTPQEDRERIINEFHEHDSSFKVVIANPHAVGESISLHKACHNALYIEQGYNAGAYMQSKDRIHRVGLLPDDVTNYYYFHSKNTVDAQIYDRVIEKERKMLAVIESQEIPLLANNADFMEDTEDDIKAIIRAYYEQ